MPFGKEDPYGIALKEYKENKVKTVYVLLSKIPAKLVTEYSSAGISAILIYCPELKAPDLNILRPMINAISLDIIAGNNIAVHCHAGVGRTGAVLACLAKDILKLNGGNAIEFIRRYVPGAVESQEQEKCVMNY